MQILSNEQIEQLSRNFKKQMVSLSDIDFIKSSLMNEDKNVGELRKQVFASENNNQKDMQMKDLLGDFLWEADTCSTSCVCMSNEKNISADAKAKSIEMQIRQLSENEIQQTLNGEIDHRELFFMRLKKYAEKYKEATGENRKFPEGKDIEDIVKTIYSGDKYGEYETFVEEISNVIKEVNNTESNKDVSDNTETKKQEKLSSVEEVTKLIKNFKTKDGTSFEDYREKVSNEFEEIMSVENLIKFNSLVEEVITRLEKNDRWQNLDHPKDSERPFEALSIELALPENRAGRIFRAENEDGSYRDVVTINPISFTKYFDDHRCKNDEDKLACLEAFVIHELTHGDQYNRNPKVIPIDRMPSLVVQNSQESIIDNIKWLRGIKSKSGNRSPDGCSIKNINMQPVGKINSGR